MIKWFVKKQITGYLNKTLGKYKSNVELLTKQITVWCNRLRRILACLENLSDRLKDAELTDKELNDTLSDIEQAIKEF